MSQKCLTTYLTANLAQWCCWSVHGFRYYTSNAFKHIQKYILCCTFLYWHSTTPLKYVILFPFFLSLFYRGLIQPTEVKRNFSIYFKTIWINAIFLIPLRKMNLNHQKLAKMSLYSQLLNKYQNKPSAIYLRGIFE